MQLKLDAPSHRRTVLAMLFLVYLFNFIDRQIIGILAGPIKKELALSDTQLGLMGGLAFALFYTGLGIPVSRLADRTSRTWVMTAALGLWSGFTAACGIAHGFWQLFLARVGVGVGEAGGVAPAYALLADYFPPRERARAMAVYSLAVPIGTGLGILLGGWVATAVSWRAAFLVVGLAGLILAPVFRLVVKEPRRGAADGAAPQERGLSLVGLLALLARKPSFWGMSLGAACASIVGYGSFFWMPSFLIRSFHLTLAQAATCYGSIVLIGGVVGVLAGGILGDRLGQKRQSAYCALPAIALLLAVPAYAAGLLVPNLMLVYGLFLIPTALGTIWLGPVVTAVQHLVEPGQRATASSMFLFILNLIGIGFGTVFFGLLSDAYTARFGSEALRYSMLTGLGFYVVAAGLYFTAARHLANDWMR
jgi:MFS family permease